MSEDVIQIQWTCGNLEEARRVASELVEQRLVACVNIVPNIESIYVWEGKVNRDQEVKVLLKTRASLFEQVEAVIEREASYDVSEILAVPIVNGNRAYLEWLEASCKG